MHKLVDLLAYWCKKYGLDPRTAIFGHGRCTQNRQGRLQQNLPRKERDMNAVRGAVANQLKSSSSGGEGEVMERIPRSV